MLIARSAKEQEALAKQREADEKVFKQAEAAALEAARRRSDLRTRTAKNHGRKRWSLRFCDTAPGHRWFGSEHVNAAPIPAAIVSVVERLIAAPADRSALAQLPKELQSELIASADRALPGRLAAGPRAESLREVPRGDGGHRSGRRGERGWGVISYHR